jgi:putative endonuclease
MVASTRQLGQAGEDRAEKYFQEAGYGILGRNLTSRYGEVDLVVQKAEQLFFVEIKWRQSQNYGRAIEAVSREKQRRIRRTAELLLIRNPGWKKWIPFFSVLAIDENEDGTAAIEFVPDAFM